MNNIRSASVKDTVEVLIQAATKQDGKLWDSEIRPATLAKYPKRTEYKWTRLIGLLPYASRLVFGWKARKSYALGVFAQSNEGNAILSGLMLVVEGVRFPPDLSKRCLYVWYVSSAPDSYVQAMGGRLVPRSGEVLLDAAIVSSFKAGFDGRILLHAAPTGGQELLDYYKHFGLDRLPDGVDIPRIGGRNDGRFFVADELTAQYIVRRNNRRREAK